LAKCRHQPEQQERKMYEAHPASELFPMMDIVGLAALTRDIKANGLRESIVLWEGKILDGRNRLWACRKAGVEPRFRELEECVSPTATVLSLNLYRRQLSVSQRAMIGALAKRELKKEARLRQEVSRFSSTHQPSCEFTGTVRAKFPPPETAGKARDHAAALVGVSGRTVETACQVLSSENPEIIEAVRAGRMTVNKAAQLLSQPETESLPISAEALPAVEPARIHLCSSAKFINTLPIETADLLISRPVFDTAPDYFEAHAQHWLGLAVAPMKYTSRIFLICDPDIDMVHALSAACRRHPQFKCCDVAVWNQAGPVRGTLGHDYRRQHHLILHIRGLDAPLLNAKGSAEGSSVHSNCGSFQQLAERLIGHCSKPGDLVIDPCAGPGDVLAAATKLGRRGFGATSNEVYLQMAQRKGCLRHE